MNTREIRLSAKGGESDDTQAVDTSTLLSCCDPLTIDCFPETHTLLHPCLVCTESCIRPGHQGWDFNLHHEQDLTLGLGSQYSTPVLSVTSQSWPCEYPRCMCGL
jgi:hypothetical protein